MRNHFEQSFHVSHRLARYGARTRMDYAQTDPEALAHAITDGLKRPVLYRDVTSKPTALAGPPRSSRGSGERRHTPEAGGSDERIDDDDPLRRPDQPLRQAGRRDTIATTASSPKTSRSCAPRATSRWRCRRSSAATGMSLAEVCREQRRLAYRAPATALATNMHLYWTGVAADLRKAGDQSLEWMLREAAAGEVFAAGHGEAGNDLPLFLSTARAERVDGGYRFTGHKIFGSLTPVWTRLGLHAMDTTDPRGPQIVHAFMPRDAKGYSIKETWDTLGMRATRSDDTILDGAFVPDRYIARRAPGRRRRSLRARRSSRGPSRPSPASTSAWRSARATWRRPGSRSARRSPSPGRWRTTRRSSTASPRCSWRSRRRAPRSSASPTTGRHGVDHGMAVADEARRRQVQRGRGRQDGRRPRDGRLGRDGHVQVERARAPLPRRRAAAASTRRTRSWSTRSSARRSSGSTSASSRDGVDRPSGLGGGRPYSFWCRL